MKDTQKKSKRGQSRSQSFFLNIFEYRKIPTSAGMCNLKFYNWDVLTENEALVSMYVCMYVCNLVGLHTKYRTKPNCV